MLWLLACTPGFEMDLLDGPNHLLPLYVAVHERHVYSFSRMHGTLAVLTDGELTGVFPLEDFPPAPAGLVAENDGVWVLFDGHALKVSPDGAQVAFLDQPVLDVDGDRFAAPEGVYIGGELMETPGVPLKLLEGGRVLLEDGTVLDESGQILCQAPFGSRRAVWGEGSVYVAKGAQIGRCGGGTVTLNEPKTVLWMDGELWALDRIGDEDPNQGQLRVLSPQLELLRSAPTGKNSGYGGWDGDTLWVNSEGSSELLGLVDETLSVAVTTGVHVESVEHGVVTGRLSNRVWNDTRSRELIWPVAPRWFEDKVWVVLQQDMTLVALDPVSLETVETVETGLGPHNHLTLSDTAVWNDALWVSDGQTDALWSEDRVIPLGQPLDKDASGRLELVVGDDALYVVRARDGRVHRVTTEGVTAEVRVDIEPRTRMQLGAWDEGVLWVGGVGLDGETLQVVDRGDFDFFVGRVGRSAVVWDEGLWVGDDLVHVQTGEELPEVVIEGRSVLVTDIEDAAVRSFRP